MDIPPPAPASQKPPDRSGEAGGGATVNAARSGNALLALLASPQPDSGLMPGAFAAPRITVERDVGVTTLFGRRDVVVRVRVECTSPLSRIAMLADAVETGLVLIPGSDRAAGPFRRQCVAMQVARPEADLSRRIAFRLTAEARDGSAGAAEGVIELEGSGSQKGTVTGAAAPPSSGDFHPQVMIYLERASIDPAGVLSVHGWALGHEPVATVQITVDGAPVGAARLGGSRPDVAAVFPDYRDAALSGFSLAVQLDQDAAAVVRIGAQAVARDGASQSVVLVAERSPARALLAFAAQPASMIRRVSDESASGGRTRVQLFCDRAALAPNGRVAVSGWAYSPAGLIGATLKVGDATVRLPPIAPGTALVDIAVPPDFFSTGAEPPLVVHLSAVDAGGERAGLTAVIEARTKAAEPQPQDSEFWLEIDDPPVGSDGFARVGGRLELRGWALAMAGLEALDALLDGRRIGSAVLELERPDVLAAHAMRPDALRSGFTLAASMRAVPNGEHALELRLRDRAGKTFSRSVKLLVGKAYATLRTELTLAELNLLRDVADRLGAHGGISLALRQHGPVEPASCALMDLTLCSLRGQSHQAWSLAVAADGPREARAWMKWIAAEHPALMPRVAVAEMDAGQRLDAAIRIGTGLTQTAAPVALVGLIGPGDVLSCDALSEVAMAHALNPDAQVLYADDIRVNPATLAAEPFFKPDWSPELLLSANYIGRPWFAAPAAIGEDRIGLADFLSAGEYHALLRTTERAQAVRRIPRLLCERRGTDVEPPASEIAALSAAASRRGFPSKVVRDVVAGSYRMRARTAPAGLVSVIVPTCYAGGLIEACIASLRAYAGAGAIEIVAVDTVPDAEPEKKAWLAAHADRVASASGPFNWSRLNNEGAKLASGRFLVFLNDDVAIPQIGWLAPLLDLAARPEIGVVGPRLLYPDGTVQHAGMFLARMGLARHAFRFLGREEPGYFGLARTQRNVSCVTGACMVVRRDVFDAVGGFDEAHAVINNDLDFCLRVQQAGYRVVYTPHTTLVHAEGASRKGLPEPYDAEAFARRWRPVFAAGDPFHNPNLSRETDDLAPDEEPVRAVQGGHPLFRHADVERILAVKLDHIGDVITALPALRLLRLRFPDARITLLAGSFARGLAEAEACADSFIAFDFYKARSQNGRATLTAADYAALHRRLSPYRFDLAVDLRKHPDTRDVLRHVPARLLAGFDQDGRFPFLDVALEWAADRPLQRKRQHVSEDLVNLVDAVSRACRPERPAPPLPEPDRAALRGLLPDAALALWDRPVVAVHPGVGNVMRQWPPEQFADLVDLLTLRSGVSVVLIGAAEEQAIGEAILARVARPDLVASLMGLTTLHGLERLLPQCALYVGNNSGPHHLAAALGVPTVGVHSGVVDPAEWAPAGPRAVALSKQMTCSPCYLAEPEQCRRDLACLRQLSPATVHRYSEMLMARGGGSQGSRA